MDIEDIAITGISGRFPNADSIEELRQALLNGTDLITDDHKRWPHGSLKTPPSMGILHDFENFDAAFFEINPKAAELHDPRGRKLLEVVFESIVDAGFNPGELKGSNAGVFVGIMQNSLNYDYLKPGSGINSSTYIIANNISYIFDLHGPSCGIDTGCSSSIYVLNQAVESMRLGVCDTAVVCSAHANFLPYDSMEFSKLGVLNPQGRCRTFDDDRRGYVKSESVVAIFLQKIRNSRRIYATIKGIGCNVDGYKEDGLLHPSSRMQVSLLRDVYERYNIDPGEVTYVECHGTGTLVGDIEECQGIAEFFGHQRETPLHIGSIKTNVGHTEATGGLVSLIKLLITIQSGVIPANLHFKTPATDIPSVFDGKLKVVSQNTRYKEGLLAVNSFGLGGANGHLVIKPYIKMSIEKNRRNLKTHRLVQVSGRTQQAVEVLLDRIIDNRDDEGFLALIDDVFSTEIKGYHYRGYSILNSSIGGVSKCPSSRRPIWFSYSGMGSQWPQMAKDLFHFETFKNTMNKCAKPLEPYGLNLHEIVLNGTTETFNDPINCFTSIIAVSIGLTDLLYSVGVNPDGIIGHSLGEIGCAYGDGLITAEQAVLVAYARGWATKNTDLIPGLMASVGLSVEECENLLPEDIFIACDNSVNNVTISGPEKSVKLFSEMISSKGVFVRIVNTANIAFHSKYVSGVGPKLLDFLASIKLEPKLRNKWLPSAVLEDNWDSDLGKYNSAQYQCHNFLNRVLYKQVLKKVPNDAILVEIAPCGLFQAIFRRGLEESITKLHLVKKHCHGNHEFLLNVIGRLYLAGAQPITKSLSQRIDYPLGSETSMISPLIKWNHTAKWSLPKFDPHVYFGRKIEVNTSSKENKFLLGHIVNGKNVFPTAGYVCLIWEAFANMLETVSENFPIIIEKLKVMKTVFLPKNDSINFTINILKTGFFEISDKMDVIATGKIIVAKDEANEFSFATVSTSKTISEDIKLNTDDVYKIFFLRGYEYEGNFKSIKEINYTNRTATVKWTKNWTTLLDSMLQTIALLENSLLALPKEILKISINPISIKQKSDHGHLAVTYNHVHKSICCNGIKIHNIVWSKMVVKKRDEHIFNTRYEFVTNIDKHVITEQEKSEKFLHLILQIVVENSLACETIKILEVAKNDSISYKDDIKRHLHPKYLKNMLYRISYNVPPKDNDYNLILLQNFEVDNAILQFFKELDERTFVYTEDNNSIAENVLKPLSFVTIFERKSINNSIRLFRKIKQSEECNVIEIAEDDSSWIERIEEMVRESLSKVLLIEKHFYLFHLDIISFFNYCKDKYPNRLRLFSIKDKEAEEFSLDSSFYQEQLKKDLAVNILCNNKWGTYRHLPIENCQVNLDACLISLINNQFQWIQQNSYIFGDNKVHVAYSSLDSWDQPATYRQTLMEKVCLGLEYSGVTDSGVRVMGISPNGSLRTHLTFHHNLTWTVPQKWNLKEAATIPLACAMSYYGLFIKGNLQRQHTILTTYSGSSIEVAAISLILDIGCKLLVTVSSEKYRKLLTTNYPELKNNIIDLYDKNDDAIMEMLHRQSLDIIFNCGSLDDIISALYLLKSEGKLIDINFDNQSLPSVVRDILSEKNCTVYTLTLNCLLKEQYYVLENIRIAIQTYVDNNVIKPFYSDNIRMIKVTKLLNNLKRIPNGKVTVKICQERQLKRKNKFLAYPTTYLDPNKSYIVISNLDTFDLEVVHWLNERGGKKLVLNSSDTNTSGYISLSLEKLRSKGSNVVCSSFDVTSRLGVRELISSAQKLSSIGGIFYLSGPNQTPTVFGGRGPKFHCVQNLDILSVEMCKNLDYFVVFSSIYSTLGGKGQLTCDCTQAAIECLCEDRSRKNLPVLNIRWGPITNYGSISRFKRGKRCSDEVSQSIASCLETLDTFMQSNATICDSVAFDVQERSEESVNTGVADYVAKIFGIKNVAQMEASTPLVNLGMDSMMGFEMKSLLYSQFGVNYSVNDIRKLTLENIRQMEQRRKITANKYI